MASTDKRYYWIKLKRDFFRRHDVQILGRMNNGHEFQLFYLKLLCESVDHEGRLRFSDDLPYTPSMLAALCEVSEGLAIEALEALEKLNLIEKLEDGTYYLPKVAGIVGSESHGAVQKRNQKELPKLAEGSKRLNADMMRLPNGKVQYVDEKRYGGNGMLVMSMAGGRCELCGADNNLCIHHNNGYSNDINDLFVLCSSCHGRAHSTPRPVLSHNWQNYSSEGVEDFEQGGGNVPAEYRDKEYRDIKPLSNDKGIESTTPNQVLELYAQICHSFPAVKVLSENRKKAIKARLNIYSLEDFKKLFEKAEASSFLKGANDHNWSATFDWLIKDSNMAKVLEGNYDDKPKKGRAKKNNAFNEIEHNEYDFDDLERKLISN